MSSILNSIKSIIASSIKVEVKNPVTRNGKTRFPLLVTDMGQSFTSGWFVQYNPVAQDNNTRLYDGSESFSELHITKFSELMNLILTGNYYFLQGAGVEQLQEGRRRAIYEPNASVRLTVTSQSNSVSVVVTITDEISPFHMMSIPFTVTNQNGQPYVIGTEKYWDRNTDMFTDFNANFAPRKSRFYRVQQQQNQPAFLRAKIAVVNGQYAINPDGTFQVNTQASAPEYIQVISNEFKALAYIYEQALMDKAFELALAQGLPTTAPQQAPNPNGQSPMAPNGFVPAFAVTNPGQPMQQQQPAFNSSPPMQQPVPNSSLNQMLIAPNGTEQQQAPIFQAQQQQQPNINTNDLPWVTN